MEDLQRKFRPHTSSRYSTQSARPLWSTGVPGGKPTMFICGNDESARKSVGKILDEFGWETADMGGAESARAIEPLCMLWCLPGFLRNEWTHAFKMIKM